MTCGHAWRAALSGALLIGASSLCSGCAPSPLHAPGSGIDRGKCGDFELDVDRFWSSSTKGEVKAGILKVGGDWTAQASERVITKMDNLTRDWVMMQEGVCKDTLVREVMPREVYVKVSLCLRSSLIAQRTLVETLKDATKDHLLNVDAALAQVQTDSADCQREAIYSAYNDAPDDTAAEQAREKIAEAGVYRKLQDDRSKDASREGREAAARSQSVRVKVDALIDQASQASYNARFDDVAPIAQQALQLAESDGYDLGVARALGWLGDSYTTHANFPLALETIQRELAIYQKILGENDPETARAYIGLAIVNSDLSDFPLSLQMFQKALSIQLKGLGDKHPAVAITYERMGWVYEQQGNYPAALEMFQKSLAIWRSLPGDTTFMVDDEMSSISTLCKEGYKPACSVE